MALGIDSRLARSAWSHAAVYLLVALTTCVVWVIRQTLLVFATALMLAYLLYPLVDKLERRLPCKTRVPALVLPFVLILGFFTTFGLVVRGPVTREIDRLHDQITSTANGQPAFERQVANWKPWGLPIGERVAEMDVFSELMTTMPGLEKTMGTTLRYLGNLFIIPILSFLVLKDGRILRDSVMEIFDRRPQVESLLMDAHTLLLEYMRALLLLCLATLFSFTICLSLMGVRYAILLGFVAFALEFVPLIGPFAAAIIIVGVSEFNNYPHIAWLVVFLICYRVFQDYVLSPQFMKKGVNLHPLLVMLGVFAGGEIGGVPGIFLSVPVLAFMRLVYFEIKNCRT